MKYKFPDKIINILSNLPETAMGSQHVDIYMNDGSVIHNLTVFNCMYYEGEKEINTSEIVKITHID